ncbi:DNA-directed RNA polymerase subunit delta [Evansella cellulosilytica]|uniref:Probable DNA-directed RNA polymerase subunit delta n=1 Tax=Evansella cellulosilytica (strain ATCC 21833 / DSM 2522 / FERM P-1141 / JCM 9156 / N-4) TaxID=649639 RepID=E6TXE4_EVAC2|nr:DNA-directed RNA polymerase subunit delta [Evansella cellulosilytica]ADU32339.1 DNA-directed RNA polymerase delta subunit [Evansella cellulosilytica DSM 2522]
MSIKQYSEAQLKEIAMLELANEILQESKNPVDYHSILNQIAEAKGMSEDLKNSRIAHLYAEMSMDGRFVNIGENRWGLRSWYPFDQTEEELSQANKTRKKKRKEEEEDDLFEDEDDFDEFEDLEDELDELANEEDEDFDEDDDEDEDIDEFDEDLEETDEDEDVL